MKLLLSFILLLLSSCAATRSEQNKALEHFATQYEKALSYRYIFSGNYNYIMQRDDTEEISLTYGIRTKKRDIASVREIATGFIDSFGYMINADEKMQPYLYERPFPLERCTLSIFLERAWESPRKTASDVTFILFRRNTICYCHYDPMEQFSICLHKETYEEAKSIVDEQRRKARESAAGFAVGAE